MTAVSVGNGRFHFQVVPEWGQFPPGYESDDIVAVSADSAGRVYVFNRGPHPVIIFEPDGQFLRSWGEGQFARPHGVHIGPDDSVYCVDDRDHTVRTYSVDGRLLMKLGTSGTPSDTGIIENDYRTIRKDGGPPFHGPTDLAVAPDGSLVISDGYRNARVHQFSSDGKLLHSWGSPGAGPGQFNLPHGIAVDRAGRVYVADRENSRIQIFGLSGEFLAQWTDVVRPTKVFIDGQDNVFVTELGWKAGLFPWLVPPPSATFGRLSIFDLKGTLQARWGGGNDPTAPGKFFAPHNVWVDRVGDLYVCEVLKSAGFNRSLFARGGHALQKFVRIQ